MPETVEPSAVVIGGGPAGSTVSRLLALWGHRVVLLDNSESTASRDRGLAESLPPSTRKVLEQADLLQVVDGANFYRSTGNTVSWSPGECRVETFGGSLGYQVFRPAFDELLRDAAAVRGVDVRASARATEVVFDAESVIVRYTSAGLSQSVRCRWVLDCSGRAGVIARRYRIQGRRTYALAGDWSNKHGWNMPDPTHTFVEAYSDGWSWSVPVSPTLRQAGVMVDGTSPRRDGLALADAYRREIDKSVMLATTLRDATLQRVWACDASTYSSRRLGGAGFLLVGDAGSFIDPLSSFGVKKALTAAWMAATVVNTCLVDCNRFEAAVELFTEWDRDVCATHARRSRQFARAAAEHYPSPFWERRADAAVGEGEPARPAEPQPADVAGALRALRDADVLDLSIADRVRFAPRPVIRGREVVLEEALALPQDGLETGSTNTTRFVDNVDIVALARLATGYRSVPEVFNAYCERCGPTSLPRVLGGLSWLIASGVLRQRNAVPC
jgi:flavin-dependent dehydrogenase